MSFKHCPVFVKIIYQHERKRCESRLNSMLTSMWFIFNGEFQRIVLKRSYSERLSKALKREKERSHLK